MKERLAILEHDNEYTHERLKEAYTLGAQAATKDDLHEFEVGLIHDSNQRYNSVSNRVEKLENKRVFRDWIGGIALAVSIIYSIVLTVRALLIR